MADSNRTRLNETDPQTPETEPHRFEIDASIVFQLGEDLITDVVQAVVELVKNSYDADADYATITVVTRAVNDYKDTFFPHAKGYVIVKDNGIGMDEATIRRGWLTISNSLKREMKRRQETTLLKHRTPLGDKGLGRLGAQRVGYNVEIFTKPKGGDTQFHVGWSWKDFEGEKTLSQVPIKWQPQPSAFNQKSGTTLLVSDLREPEVWDGKNVGDRPAFEAFQQKLSQMISPYWDFQSFRISGSVNDKQVELAEITSRVRNLAHLRYRIDFDEQILSIAGRARLSFLRPRFGDELSEFSRLVDADQGEKFFNFLADQKRATEFGIRKGRSSAWFVEFSCKNDFASLPAVRLVDSTQIDGGDEVASARAPTDRLQQGGAPAAAQSESEITKRVPASPGPFHAEVDAFDLGHEPTGGENVFDSLSEYRNYIKDLSGVRIFRDGFGIRVDRDWLGLGRQWTGASSWYALKPENTMGFVALTAKENSSLVETTDREGFKNTPEYENFLALFDLFVKFAHDAQEFLRRGWLEYLHSEQRDRARVGPEEQPKDLYRRLGEGLSAVADIREPLTRAHASLKKAGEASRDAFARLKGSSADAAQLAKLREAASSLQDRLVETQELVGRIEETLEEASRLKEVLTVAQNEMKALQERLNDVYQAASLGLTAEALSHEISNVADQMARRTQDVTKHLIQQKLTDTKVLAYTEYMKSSIAALRKQMAHLAPSLRYVRERRESIDVAEFLKEVEEYYRSRWVGKPIRLQVRSPGPRLRLSINRGKLTQIIDNLVYNSEYWLDEELRTGRIKEGLIRVDISPPFVRISDNGPGVDPNIEQTLFEAFVSTKPRQQMLAGFDG
jgi:signal transduction histidine kinase